MNDRPASGPRSPDPFPALRVAALIAAILGMLVLAAAAFVLSYPGIHQLARTAGMSVTLARVFPVIFDALLIVAIASVLSLHGAGWWRRGYSWLITLLLLAAMAAGGVLHAVHPQIPHRPAAVTAAVLPWALLLIAFSLLLSMLRQFRQARLGPPAGPAAAEPAAVPVPAEPRTGLDSLFGPPVTRIIPAQPSRLSTTAAQAPAAQPPSSQPPPAEVPATRASTVPSTRPAPQPGPDRAAPDQPASTQAAGATPPGTEPPRPTSADTQAGGTASAVNKPADRTTPTGTGWGGRSHRDADHQDVAGTSNGAAGQIPAATGSGGTEPADSAPAGSAPAGHAPGSGAADRPADGTEAESEPADAAPSVSEPSDSQPGDTGSARPTDRATGQPSVPEPAAATPDEPGAPTPSSGADQADRPDEPPASPGAGPIRVPQQPMRAPVPAPSPHFDRLRSTPTPPEDDPDAEA